MTVSGIPGIIQTEVLENTSAPDRCILKVFEFYCFKRCALLLNRQRTRFWLCVLLVNFNDKNKCFFFYYSQIQNGPFYKCLRQDYTPRTPWFTSQPLDQRHIYQMLVRASMISNNSSDNFSWQELKPKLLFPFSPWNGIRPRDYFPLYRPFQ